MQKKKKKKKKKKKLIPFFFMLDIQETSKIKLKLSQDLSYLPAK